MTDHSLIQVKDSIAAQLLQVVFSFYLILTITVTLVHMFAEYNHTKEGVLKEFSVIQKTFEPGLAKAIWDVNLGQIQSTFLGMAEMPSIIGVKVVNEQGEPLAKTGIIQDQTGQIIYVKADGTFSSTTGYTGLFWHEFPITYLHEGKLRNLGNAIIYSSSSIIFEKVRLGFFFIVVNSIIKTAALWILFLWVARHLLTRPLARLTQVTEQLVLDNLENVKVTIQTSRRNELKILEEAFNTMIQKLSHDAKQIRAMTQTFQKFVPLQFLNRIASQGLETVELGKAESDTVTILFSDIRSFTALSEIMSPQELLNFLNAYFQRMNESIHANHGFIDKYIGDAIMALFDRRTPLKMEGAMDAVQAAISMQKALSLYNQHRRQSGYLPIAAGIGIHTGKVVIGTVGSHARMDSTVLGDSVNLASRIEGLTKYYNAQIIISSDTYRLLDEDSQMVYRELDFVRVKGKDKPVSIFEVLNADPETVLAKKQQILSRYYEGLMCYYSRQWRNSMQLFEECLKIYPDDTVSQMYISRCLQYQENPPLPDWDGTLRMQTK